MKFSNQIILRSYRMLFAQVLCCFVLSGCIKEDLSTCGGFEIAFRQTINKDREDLFGTAVKKINLFVFDANGLFVGEFKEKGNHLNNQYRMRPALADGVYDMYVWGEINDDFSMRPLTVGVSTYQDALLSLQRPPSGVVNQSITPIFHGKAENVAVNNSKSTLQVIDMMNNVNSIRVITKGLPTGRMTTPAANENEFTCKIVSANGDYNFDNTRAGSELLTYIPKHPASDESIVSDFHTIRLFENDLLTKLTLNYGLNTDGSAKEIYSANLIELLCKNPEINTQEDLDRLSEYIIVITIDSNTNIVTSVTVNGWKVGESSEDL